MWLKSNVIMYIGTLQNRSLKFIEKSGLQFVPMNSNFMSQKAQSVILLKKRRQIEHENEQIASASKIYALV